MWVLKSGFNEKERTFLPILGRKARQRGRSTIFVIVLQKHKVNEDGLPPNEKSEVIRTAWVEM